jgi:peptidoglycan/xylan/chitin deacetylase (PgdA/CDA1 family)
MVALTFDDGPDPEVTPRVLEMLDRAGARATFFVIGNRAARHPELVQEIVAAGHVLGNHTWTHSPAFSMFTPGQIARELDATQELLAQIAGTRPRLFRAPAGVRGPFLQLMLPPRELLMVSWTRRGFDAVTTRAAGVHRRLVRGLSSGDILLLHDGQSRWMYRRRLASGAPPVVLEVLPGVLASLQSQGLRSGALGTDIPLDQLV